LLKTLKSLIERSGMSVKQNWKTVKKFYLALVIFFFIYFDFMFTFPIVGLIFLVIYISYSALRKRLNKEDLLKNKVMYISIIAEIIVILSVAHIQFIISIERGNKIINAVEQYKNDKGEYPEKLFDLQSNYLKVIPKTMSFPSRKYSYFLIPDKTRFYFSFLRGLYSGEFYNYKEKEWDTIYLFQVLYEIIKPKDYVQSENLDSEIMQAIDDQEYDTVNQLISKLKANKDEQEMQKILNQSLMYSFETMWSCPDCPNPPDFTEEEKVVCGNIKKSDIYNRQFLSKCDFYNSIKIKEKIIELVNDINIINKYKQTPLLLSLNIGNYNIFQKLINKGAQIKKEQNPLKRALFCKSHFLPCRAPVNKKIVKYLIDNGFDDFERFDNDSPYKCFKERVTKCEKELKSAEEKHSKDKDGDGYIKMFRRSLKNYREILKLFSDYERTPHDEIRKISENIHKKYEKNLLPSSEVINIFKWDGKVFLKERILKKEKKYSINFYEINPVNYTIKHYNRSDFDEIVTLNTIKNNECISGYKENKLTIKCKRNGVWSLEPSPDLDKNFGNFVFKSTQKETVLFNKDQLFYKNDI